MAAALRQRRGGVFLGIAVLLMAALFAIGQGSGAVLPVHDAQHPGNHYDEVRLTLALEQASSFAEFEEAMPWGATLLRWSYAVGAYLGIESTTGRRLLSVALATLALVYLIWVLFRYGVLPPAGALLAGLFFAISGGISLYATIGLTPNAALLLYSTLFIHLLVRNAGSPLAWPAAVGYGALLALLTFLYHRAVTGVGAVVTSLMLCELFRSRWNVRKYMGILGKYVVLGVPALASAIVYLALFPPQELLEPRRGFYFYFMLSETPKTVWGAVYFALSRTKALFTEALAPVSVVFAGEMSFVVIGWCLLALMVIGWFRSLVQPRSYRFALGLALLIGVAGHLALAYATIAPYGNLRYFLPFVSFFPVFAALGFFDVLAGGRWILHHMHGMKPGKLGARWRTQVLSWAGYGFSPAIVLCLGLYMTNIVQRNQALHGQLNKGFGAVAEACAEGPVGFVVDDWTHVTLQHRHDELLEKKPYTLPITRRTERRGSSPAELASVADWKGYLAANDRIFAITSMPFREKYYGPIYDEATARFRVQPVAGTPALFVTEFKLRRPDQELLSDANNVLGAAWRRSRASVESLAGGTFRAKYEPAGIIAQRIPLTVAKGERLVFSVTIEAEREIAGMRLMLKRADKGPMDGVVEKITVGTEPQRYIVSHRFERTWRHVSAGIAAPAEAPATVSIQNPSLRATMNHR